MRLRVLEGLSHSASWDRYTLCVNRRTDRHECKHYHSSLLLSSVSRGISQFLTLSWIITISQDLVSFSSVGKSTVGGRSRISQMAGLGAHHIGFGHTDLMYFNYKCKLH